MPDQRMRNAVCEIIATAVNTHSPYTPYVTASYRAYPWEVPGSDREKASAPFDKKMKRFNIAQQLSIQKFPITLILEVISVLGGITTNSQRLSLISFSYY